MAKNLQNNDYLKKKFFNFEIASILVSIIFFVVLLFVISFHHSYWYERDGIYYLNAGIQILEGNGENIKFFNAPPGGPVLFAFLTNIFLDSFFVEKIIALASGTGIVILTYLIIRNIFNSKIAFLGQIFIASQFSLQYFSTQALNDLLPISMIGIALYFITKKDITYRDILIIGLILGVSSTVRYTGIICVISIVTFLIIRNRQIQKNISQSIFILCFFLLGFSPVLIFNFVTYDTFLDTSLNFYLLMEQIHQTEHWRETVETLTINDKSASPLIDVDLFFKNYFYNLLSHNPNKLFHFSTFDNISLIPALPFISMIPVFGGSLYIFQIKIDKKLFLQILSIMIITLISVLIFGDVKTHWFSLILFPILFLGIYNFKKINRQILPLLLFPLIFFFTMSIMPMYRATLMLPMWYSIAILSSIFFVNGIPSIQKYFLGETSNEQNK